MLKRIREVGRPSSELLQQQYGLDSAPVRSVFEAINSAESAEIYAELTPVTERPDIGIQQGYPALAPTGRSA